MSGNKFWSTNLSRKRDDYTILLMYRGGLTFSDTVRKTDMQRYRLEHPTPPPLPRDPTPPPPQHEETPSPQRPRKDPTPPPGLNQSLQNQADIL